jgi:hypothetical protein
MTYDDNSLPPHAVDRCHRITRDRPEVVAGLRYVALPVTALIER